MVPEFSHYVFSSPAPTITVRVTSSVATPVVGSMYSLTCTVTGAEGLTDAMVTYQWCKNGAVVSGQIMATLSFSSLSSSNAGSYTCEATVTSSLLSGPITTAPSNSLSVQPTCRFFLNFKYVGTLWYLNFLIMSSHLQPQPSLSELHPV